MALQKQNLPINFTQGLDLKTDPLQVTPGKFLQLQNTVFDKAGRLTKRNGYGALTPLPDTSSTFVTTFNGNLTAIGNNLTAYSQSAATWTVKGKINPLKLTTLPLIRSNTNQSQADTAITANGLICTVFIDNVPNGGSTTPHYKYAIADSNTGQNIVPPTPIIPSTGVVAGPARVFLLGSYFVIVMTTQIGGNFHLQYQAISTINPTISKPTIDISSRYIPSSSINFDGVVANNSLYLAWNGNDGGGAVRMTYIDSTLAQHNTTVTAGLTSTIIAICADNTTPTPIIYVTSYNSGTAKTFAVSSTLIPVFSPTVTYTGATVPTIAQSAQNNLCTLFFETTNTYGYGASLPTNLITKNTITIGGVAGTQATTTRSLGLASKSFIINGVIYYLGIYSSAYQPTYFLMNSNGEVVAKLAYSNAGSYYTTTLPSVTVYNNTANCAYFFKDLIQAVNKTQGVVNSAGVYSQTGINLATFAIGTSAILTSEIANNLHLTGGILTAYDGYVPVEQGFNLWPDNVIATTSSTGGFMTSQLYYYQATYEWTDNQGNAFRSAPSIPSIADCTGLGTSTCSVTVNVPTLRLTYKIANPVKIVLYRWSLAQQNYYQTTSITIPNLNDVTVDSIAIVDKNADASILGNNLIYTTGGVLEDIGPPATDIITLFNNRLWLVDAEDRNLLWYSKQVIESVPVEMSDLLTLYVAPTTGSQGSTGPITAMSAMDDKLILFKKDAIYYINGNGPDNTGANSQYSEPLFITSTVGCANQQSIVFMPQGLMFQSDKGIWLLGRDLSTMYIGAPVEAYNASLVDSAVNVPATNQVRFTLANGITLMYDYYFGQWGSFVNVPAISSTLYESLHTYTNSFGQVFQETPGLYLDGSKPVLMSFQTSWFNLAGLQGFERAYYFYLIANYVTPHKLSIQISYDYNPNPTQAVLISPDNFSGVWGSDPLWGDANFWGGNPTLEQWRIFLNQQKCQAFQINLTEFYDNEFNTNAGAGLTISGLNLIYGFKKGYVPLKASRSVG